MEIKRTPRINGVNRVKPSEKISKIFEVLEKKEEQTDKGCFLTDLVDETGMTYQTVHEYIQLILDVQHRRHVEIVFIGKKKSLRLCPEGMYRELYPKGPP